MRFPSYAIQPESFQFDNAYHLSKVVRDFFDTINSISKFGDIYKETLDEVSKAYNRKIDIDKPKERIQATMSKLIDTFIHLKSSELVQETNQFLESLGIDYRIVGKNNIDTFLTQIIIMSIPKYLKIYSAFHNKNIFNLNPNEIKIYRKEIDDIRVDNEKYLVYAFEGDTGGINSIIKNVDYLQAVMSNIISATDADVEAIHTLGPIDAIILEHLCNEFTDHIKSKLSIIMRNVDADFIKQKKMEEMGLTDKKRQEAIKKANQELFGGSFIGALGRVSGWIKSIPGYKPSPLMSGLEKVIKFGLKQYDLRWGTGGEAYERFHKKLKGERVYEAEKRKMELEHEARSLAKMEGLDFDLLSEKEKEKYILMAKTKRMIDRQMGGVESWAKKRKEETSSSESYSSSWLERSPKVAMGRQMLVDARDIVEEIKKNYKINKKEETILLSLIDNAIKSNQITDKNVALKVGMDILQNAISQGIIKTPVQSQKEQQTSGEASVTAQTTVKQTSIGVSSEETNIGKPKVVSAKIAQSPSQYTEQFQTPIQGSIPIQSQTIISGQPPIQGSTEIPSPPQQYTPPYQMPQVPPSTTQQQTQIPITQTPQLQTKATGLLPSTVNNLQQSIDALLNVLMGQGNVFRLKSGKKMVQKQPKVKLGKVSQVSKKMQGQVIIGNNVQVVTMQKKEGFLGDISPLKMFARSKKKKAGLKKKRKLYREKLGIRTLQKRKRRMGLRDMGQTMIQRGKTELSALKPEAVSLAAGQQPAKRRPGKKQTSEKRIQRGAQRPTMKKKEQQVALTRKKRRVSMKKMKAGPGILGRLAGKFGGRLAGGLAGGPAGMAVTAALTVLEVAKIAFDVGRMVKTLIPKVEYGQPTMDKVTEELAKGDRWKELSSADIRVDAKRPRSFSQLESRGLLSAGNIQATKLQKRTATEETERKTQTPPPSDTKPPDEKTKATVSPQQQAAVQKIQEQKLVELQMAMHEQHVQNSVQMLQKMQHALDEFSRKNTPKTPYEH